ncbi:synaptonemal complex protein 2-like [Pelodytes ibericus]
MLNEISHVEHSVDKEQNTEMPQGKLCISFVTSSKSKEPTQRRRKLQLETLISDAFKGKGFQKITELFEDKIACSSQRCSKVLLNQLDRLINKELDRNEFKHVALLLKCIQHFCKNDSQEGSTIIQQGLIAKMVLWFERTIEFLNISGKSDPSISVLIEDFYDTALVICRSDSEDGKRQLLDSFLYRLALIVTEKWPPCHLRLEALRTINCILDNVSREDKKQLHMSEEMCLLTQDLARTILEAGDYDIQVAISEALCRMMAKKWRDNLATRWFGDGFLAEAFKEIKDKDFETDCRIFLNFLNSRLQDKRGVYTFPCITVFADMDELTKPQDDKLEHFWIDFNVGSQSISFYINNMEGCLWDSVRLLKETINRYTLKEIEQQNVLNLYLKNPIRIKNKEITKVKIYFKLEHDIQTAVSRVFSEEICSPGPAEEAHSKLSNSVQTASTTYEQWKIDKSRLDKPDSGSDILFSQTSGQSSANQKSSETMSTQRILIADSQEVLIESVPLEATSFSKEQVAIVLEDTKDVSLDESTDVLEVPTMDSTPGALEMKVPTTDKQTAKLKAVDLYEFQCSSDSVLCDEVSEAKEKILVQKISRNRISVPLSSLTLKQTSSYKTHLFSESDGVPSTDQSEKSWILNFQKKSRTRSADYSRRKRRIKSRLKVLPLSSESNGEENQPESSASRVFTSLKKRPRVDGGKAKSLSSTELNLPGISALLTPGDSHLQNTTILNLSDFDENDRMDPLEETSSLESPRRVEVAAKTLSPLNVSGEIKGPAVTCGCSASRHIREEGCLDSAQTFSCPPVDTKKVLWMQCGVLAGVEANGNTKEKARSWSLCCPWKGSANLVRAQEAGSLKRKRLNSATNEESSTSVLKPRKLFNSSEEAYVCMSVENSDLADDVFETDPHEKDLGEASVISAFETFAKDLKKKFVSRYQRMEFRAQNALTSCHQQVSTLLDSIHQCRLHKLNHFQKVVVQELSSLETEAQSLKELETETLEFWEEQSENINTFCSNQKERIKAIDSAFEEKMSQLTNIIQKTTKVSKALPALWSAPCAVILKLSSTSDKLSILNAPRKTPRLMFEGSST